MLDTSLVIDAVREFAQERLQSHKHFSKRSIGGAYNSSALQGPSKIQRTTEVRSEEEFLETNGSKFRPRDYTALKLHQDFLQDMVPSVEALKIDGKSRQHNGLVLTGTQGRYGQNRLAVVTGKDERARLHIKLYFWENAKRRLTNKPSHVYSWEDLNEYSSKIRESVANILRD